MAETVKVGIIGTGNIAPAYVHGCNHFDILELKACGDIDVSRAQAFGREHGIIGSSVEELLADEEIDIIINLTIPAVHVDVSLRILQAGKHVYSEKPLALNSADSKRILDEAAHLNLRVGCAPDTFLGGGIQTCRKLIDDGVIGRPVAATAFMLSHGPESWHPNPGFFYQIGGGPLFDMGPYYIAALVNLMGGIKRLTASAQKSLTERIATSEKRNGEKLPVEINTHVAGVMDFANGAVATMITSFDVWQHHLPRIEIYGTEGSLSVPDPNTFGGEVKVWTTKTGEWQSVPLTHSDKVGRGIGVADMAQALQSNRLHRASGELAHHVVSVMESLERASAENAHIMFDDTVDRPAALPTGLPEGQLDT